MSSTTGIVNNTTVPNVTKTSVPSPTTVPSHSPTVATNVTLPTNTTKKKTSLYEMCYIDDNHLNTFVRLKQFQYPNETLLIEESAQVCLIENNSTQPTNSCFQFLNISCNFSRINETIVETNSTNSNETTCLNHRCFCSSGNIVTNLTDLQCVCFPNIREELTILNNTNNNITSSPCEYKSIIRVECQNVSSTILNRIITHPTTYPTITNATTTIATTTITASDTTRTETSTDSSSVTPSTTTTDTSTCTNIMNISTSTTNSSMNATIVPIWYSIFTTNGTCVVKPSNTTFDFESHLNDTYYNRLRDKYPRVHNVGFVKPFSDFEVCSKIHFIVFPIFIFLFITFFSFILVKKIRKDRLAKKREKDKYRVIELKGKTK